MIWRKKCATKKYYFDFLMHVIVFVKNQSAVVDDVTNFQLLTLLGLGLIKISDVSGNFNNPRPSLILNN